jgi:hypothetical protein
MQAALVGGEADMPEVTLDGDQVDAQSGAPCGDTRIVEPAPPSAAEFDDREAVPREVDHAQRGAPFGDIRMPVRRDRYPFHRASPAAENGGKELRILRPYDLRSRQELVLPLVPSQPDQLPDREAEDEEEDQGPFELG